MISTQKAIIMITVMAVLTFLTRAVPFLFFSGKRELKGFIKKLADILPLSMIAVLVIYCLKDTVNQNTAQNLVTLSACIIVCVLHIIKGNTLLSIGVGTVIYMIGLHIFCM